MLQLARGSGVVCFVLLGACGGNAPPAPPPPEVEVFVAKAQSLENITEVPGRVQAVRTAQVRARVDGIVERRLYNEGSDVKAGQTLFLIDPRELRASASAVEAALTRALATAANAKQDVERYKGLVQEQAISQQEFDAAMARLRTAEADVAQTQAQLESAKLNLSYTTVTAPIAGRAGRAQVTEGALVSASAATLLTTIEQLDPIFVNFSQSSAYLLSIRREMAAGTLKVPELGKVAVTLLLEDGTPYTHPGHLDFLDLSIDQATGTAAIRAEFPNPERILLPGQFVRARIEVGVRPHGFSIPQRAVQLTPSGANVLVVDEGDTVAARPIKLGTQQGDQWVVLEGLESGDRVIVDGLQKVQPGARVRIAAPANQPPDKSAQPTER
ncbi:MAG TPA: efflux RND transporter periplasmic adaptor subunit [Steroidobacter sp.]|uniref:efflux RND transporter periplasmic adaptor subunit n=1 Tax=Steroidobacter sp. TaxID=1978227 RepID=UPI002EDAAA4F